VRQLITRVDDELRRELKRRATAEGRSVNALVTELLRTAVARQDQRELVRARMRALGRRATIPRPRKAPSLDAVEKLTRGLGTRVSEALEADRGRR
jgi:plasmid stability protein